MAKYEGSIKDSTEPILQKLAEILGAIQQGTLPRTAGGYGTSFTPYNTIPDQSTRPLLYHAGRMAETEADKLAGLPIPKHPPIYVAPRQALEEAHFQTAYTGEAWKKVSQHAAGRQVQSFGGFISDVSIGAGLHTQLGMDQKQFRDHIMSTADSKGGRALMDWATGTKFGQELLGGDAKASYEKAFHHRSEYTLGVGELLDPQNLEQFHKMTGESIVMGDMLTRIIRGDDKNLTTPLQNLGVTRGFTDEALNDFFQAHVSGGGFKAGEELQKAMKADRASIMAELATGGLSKEDADKALDALRADPNTGARMQELAEVTKGKVTDLAKLFEALSSITGSEGSGQLMRELEKFTGSTVADNDLPYLLRKVQQLKGAGIATGNTAAHMLQMGGVMGKMLQEGYGLSATDIELGNDGGGATGQGARNVLTLEAARIAFTQGIHDPKGKAQIAARLGWLNQQAQGTLGDNALASLEYMRQEEQITKEKYEELSGALTSGDHRRYDPALAELSRAIGHGSESAGRASLGDAVYNELIRKDLSTASGENHARNRLDALRNEAGIARRNALSSGVRNAVNAFNDGTGITAYGDATADAGMQAVKDTLIASGHVKLAAALEAEYHKDIAGGAGRGAALSGITRSALSANKDLRGALTDNVDAARNQAAADELYANVDGVDAYFASQGNYGIGADDKDGLAALNSRAGVSENIRYRLDQMTVQGVNPAEIARIRELAEKDPRAALAATNALQSTLSAGAQGVINESTGKHMGKHASSLKGGWLASRRKTTAATDRANEANVAGEMGIGTVGTLGLRDQARAMGLTSEAFTGFSSKLGDATQEYSDDEDNQLLRLNPWQRMFRKSIAKDSTYGGMVGRLIRNVVETGTEGFKEVEDLLKAEEVKREAEEKEEKAGGGTGKAGRATIIDGTITLVNAKKEKIDDGNFNGSLADT